jgi:hypothetical protein
MPRKSREERMNLVLEKARGIGMGERYASALAAVSVRRRLDGRVLKILDNHGTYYAESIRMNNEMWEDPFAFQKKYLGNKRFRRFATLSLTYSDSSQIRMVLRILSDAKYTRKIDSELRRSGVLNKTDSAIYDRDLFFILREKEKRDAFYADMRGNGISREHVDCILKRIGYEELPDDYYGYQCFEKTGAIGGLYKFFSNGPGRNYVSMMRNENDHEKRDEIAQDMADSFFYAFRNDVNINPSLDIGIVYSADATKHKVLGYSEDYKPIIETTKES